MEMQPSSRMHGCFGKQTAMRRRRNMQFHQEEKGGRSEINIDPKATMGA